MVTYCHTLVLRAKLFCHIKFMSRSALNHRYKFVIDVIE